MGGNIEMFGSFTEPFKLLFRIYGAIFFLLHFSTPGTDFYYFGHFKIS